MRTIIVTKVLLHNPKWQICRQSTILLPWQRLLLRSSSSIFQSRRLCQALCTTCQLISFPRPSAAMLPQTALLFRCSTFRLLALWIPTLLVGARLQRGLTKSPVHRARLWLFPQRSLFTLHSNSQRPLVGDRCTGCTSFENPSVINDIFCGPSLYPPEPKESNCTGTAIDGKQDNKLHHVYVLSRQPSAPKVSLPQSSPLKSATSFAQPPFKLERPHCDWTYIEILFVRFFLKGYFCSASPSTYLIKDALIKAWEHWV